MATLLVPIALLLGLIAPSVSSPSNVALASQVQGAQGILSRRHSASSSILPKLHSHLLQRLKDFSGSEMTGKMGPTVRAQVSQISDNTSVGKQSSNVTGEMTIGKTKFWKNHVIAIGDIDGNGHEDYIVANPGASKGAGSIRLYLMTEKNQFLYSRELIPGMWGFEGPSLEPGDRFGTAVLRLPNEGNDSSFVLAIGAPGDTGENIRSGAVYFLRVTKKGDVVWTSKVSAETEPALKKQHDEDEGFGSDIKAIGDLNGDGDYELSVKSLSGSMTMLFLNKDAELKSALKIYKEQEEKAPDMSSIRKSISIGSLSIRAGMSAECFFNTTFCSCGLRSPEKNSASCMDVVGTDELTGKTICKARDCEQSYVCSCDGSEMCKRVDVTKNVYTSDSPAPGGNVYCSQKPSSMKVNIVQAGMAIPTPTIPPEMTEYNSTHCRCSLKKDIQNPSQCLDFYKGVQDIAVLCTARQCVQRDDDYSCDGLGPFYCSRALETSFAYLDDGDTIEPSIKFCHRDEHTVEKLTRVF